MTDLTTVPKVKASLRIEATITTWDDELQDYISAATPVIEDMTGPLITGSHTATRDGGRTALILPSGIQSVTSVTENGVAITDYTPNLAAGIVFGGTQLCPRAFLAGRQNIVIVYTAGAYASIDDLPGNISLATRELIRFWYQIGQQGGRPSFGGDQDMDEVFTPSGFAVPRRVSELCAPNPRMQGFA